MLEGEYLPILHQYISGSQSRQDKGIYQTADKMAEEVVQVVSSAKAAIAKTKF